MAFVIQKSLVGNENQPSITRLPVTASEAYTEGEALVLSSGALTKCGATAKPTHIAAETKAAAASGDVYAYEVMPHHVFKTTFAADASSNVVGTLVTLHTDGLQVTATATSGVATIYEKLGSGASGTDVLVRFI